MTTDSSSPMASDALPDASDGAVIDPDGPLDTIVDAFDPAGCPASYTQSFGTSRYRVIGTTFPRWDAAADACALDGATTHLVVLTDLAEYAAVGGFAGGTAKWVGLSDRAVPGTFQPVTDQTTSFPASGPPWNAGEPSSGCVVLQAAGTLDATACGQNFSAICECDGFANDPTNY